MLNMWQKRVGKKPMKSIPHRFPSPAGDSESDFPPYVIAPGAPSAAMSLGVGFQLPDAEGTNAIAGPSTTHRRHSNNLPVDASNIPEMDVIDVQGGRLKFYSANSKFDHRFRFASTISQTRSYSISDCWSDRKAEYVLLRLVLRRWILKGLRSLGGECGQWSMGILIPLIALPAPLHAWTLGNKQHTRLLLSFLSSLLFPSIDHLTIILW